MQFLYERTKKKEEALISMGYNVITKWECQLTLIEKNITIDPFLISILNNQLDAKDTLYGGRNEVFKLLANGIIRDIDTVSMYPTVQFFDEYPVGHYEIKT